MKILFAMIAPPCAPMHGQRLRNRALLQALQAEGHDVTLLTFDDGNAAADTELPGLYGGFCSVTPPAPARQGWIDRMSRLLTLPTPLPHGAVKYRSRPMASAISWYLAAGGYDLVICDDIYLIRNFPRRLPVPLVLNKHDFVHVILRRYLAWERNPALSAYGWIEYTKLRRFEARACAMADHVIACSALDAEIAAVLAPGISVSVVPNSIDVDSYVPQGPGDKATLLFTGSLEWHPNRDAMQYFLAEILPRIRAKIPRIKLRVTGNRPSARFIERFDPERKVEFTGWLPDIRPEIARSTIGIVPLRIGSGTRLKIMEAAAMARTVVSTSIGAEGLAFSDGREILLADEPQAFADAVVSLLADQGRREALGAAARRRVEANYGIGALRTACRQALAIARRGPRPVEKIAAAAAGV